MNQRTSGILLHPGTLSDPYPWLIHRLPHTGDKGIYLKQQLKDKLIEHKQYIDRQGLDLPEIGDWRWESTEA